MIDSAGGKATGKSERQIGRKGLIESKSRLARIPIVASGQAGHQLPFRILLTSYPNAVEGIIANLTTVYVLTQKGSIVLNDRSNAISLRGSGVFRYHIDYSTHRIGSPNRCAGTTNDLHAVKNGQRNVFGRPIDGSSHTLQNFPTIHHRKELLGGRTTEVAHGHEVVILDSSRYVHSRNVPEGVHHQNMTV